MDSATDRMAHMQQQLNTLGIPFKRMRGVVGANLKHPHPDFSDWSYKYLHGRLWTPAEVGCYLSHIECLKDFIASGADHALILEDDVSISPDIKKTIQAALKYKQSWNMLRLSTVNSGKWFAVKSLGGRNLAICLTREKGSGGYLVDKKAAHQMIKKLLPMRLAWDIAYDLEWFLGFKTLGVYPMPISQKSEFETQIQNKLRKIKGLRKYLTVVPFRSIVEITRFGYRLLRLLSLKFHN
jgi:glycosyl transferase, family 25